MIPGRPTLQTAVFQNGIKKTLGLARTGARGHQGGAGIITAETFKGPALMGMRHETGRQPRKGGLTIGRRVLRPERQRQRQIGAAKQVAISINEAVDETVEGSFWWLRLVPCRRNGFPRRLRQGQASGLMTMEDPGSRICPGHSPHGHVWS